MVSEVIEASSDPLSSAFASASDIGSVGILSIIAVFVYRYLPKLIDRAMDEQRRATETFASQLREERELFERQIAAERSACQRQFEMLLEASTEHRDAVLHALERLERRR